MIFIINEYKSRTFSNFDECLNVLRKDRDRFQNLHSNTNSAVIGKRSLNVNQLKFLIEQYSVFSKESIHMLLDAMVRNYDWPDLFQELQHNIEEEKGEETKGIPHLEIMRRGYEKDLRILTDEIQPNLITVSFIKKMRKIFNSNDNAYSAGALLAFEGVAIQEFHIIDNIIKEYDVQSKRFKVQDNNALTNYYINGHKDFEIGHENHLADSIRSYIKKDNMQKMISGYFDVCFVIDLWWQQLFLESYQVRFSEENKITDIQEFDVESVILK